MRLSHYFYELAEEYYDGIESLRTDSQGANVLKERLAETQSALKGSLNLIAEMPATLAKSFHGGFRFVMAMDGDNLLALERDELPYWDDLKEQLIVAAWTKPLVDMVKEQGGWSEFLVTAAGLEHYFHIKSGLSYEAPEGERDERNDRFDEEDEESDMASEAGQSWLEGQGFDRTDRE